MSSRRRGGFTLIELLVVVAMIGLISVFGMVGARGLLDRSHLNEATTLLESQLADARRLAKRTDVDVTFSLAEAGGTWTTNYGGTTKSFHPRIAVASGAASIDLHAPFGTYSGSTVDIVLEIGDLTRIVTVTGILAKTVVHQ